MKFHTFIVTIKYPRPYIILVLITENQEYFVCQQTKLLAKIWSTKEPQKVNNKNKYSNHFMPHSMYTSGCKVCL